MHDCKLLATFVLAALVLSANCSESKEVKDVDSVLEQAFMLGTKHEYADAVKLFTQVLREQPSNYNALKGRAVAYYCLRQNKRAIDDSGKALKMNPSDFKLQIIRFSAYLNSKNLKGALAESNRRLEHEPSADAYVQRAEIDQFIDYQKALTDCEKALELQPNNLVAREIKKDAESGIRNHKKRQMLTQTNVLPQHYFNFLSYDKKSHTVVDTTPQPPYAY